LKGENIDATVSEIRNVCVNVGFFQVVGHQVPVQVMDRVLSSMDELAGLSTETLEGLCSPTGHPFRGVRIYRDEEGVTTVVRLQVKRFDDADHAVAAGVPERYAGYFHPNVWPSEVDGLKEAWVESFMETRNLGRQIMTLFARALNLPATYFDNRLSKDVSSMSGNYYPTQSKLSTTEHDRVIFPEHTDSGMLTVLYQSGDYTGLQVKGKDGTWIDIPVVEGSFVINIGDLMARWTNGTWKSTTHRVVASRETGKARISIPTFYSPNIDCIIEPIGSCVPEGSEPLYPPITPYEWEGEFLSMTRDRNPGILS
jgi:isopenicillin N synthase-like dioxygenase